MHRDRRAAISPAARTRPRHAAIEPAAAAQGAHRILSADRISVSPFAAALVMTDSAAQASVSLAPPPAQPLDRLAAYLGKPLTTVDAPAVDHILGQQSDDRRLIRSLLSAAAQPRSIWSDPHAEASGKIPNAWHLDSAAAALDDELAALLAKRTVD